MRNQTMIVSFTQHRRLWIWSYVLCLSLCIIGTISQNAPNLAWALVRGFVRMWGYQDKGMCIALPRSAKESLRFFMSPVNLLFIFNMTNDTSVTILEKKWNVKNNWVYFQQQPMIRSNIYSIWSKPPKQARNVTLSLAVVCNATRPPFNVSIPSPIGGSNPLFTSSKGNIPAGNATFDKL